MEYYLVLKRKKKLSNQEKTWRKLQCVLSSRSSQSAKAADYVIPTPRHNCAHGKDRLWGCGAGGGEVAHGGLFGQRDHSVWYENDVGMSLDTCPNPQNAQHLECTVRYEFNWFSLFPFIFSGLKSHRTFSPPLHDNILIPIFKQNRFPRFSTSGRRAPPMRVGSPGSSCGVVSDGFACAEPEVWVTRAAAASDM